MVLAALARCVLPLITQRRSVLWGSVSSPNLVLIPPPLLVQFLPPVAHFTARLRTPQETPSAADLTVVGALGPPAALTISVLAAPSQDMGRSTAQTPRSSRGPKSMMQDLLGCQNQPTHPQKELNFKVQPQLASPGWNGSRNYASYA